MHRIPCFCGPDRAPRIPWVPNTKVTARPPIPCTPPPVPSIPNVPRIPIPDGKFHAPRHRCQAYHAYHAYQYHMGGIGNGWYAWYAWCSPLPLYPCTPSPAPSIPRVPRIPIPHLWLLVFGGGSGMWYENVIPFSRLHPCRTSRMSTCFKNFYFENFGDLSQIWGLTKY